MRRFLYGAAWLGALSVYPTTVLAHDTAVGPKDGTVLIIRHGEKPASGTGLSPIGQERAQKYIGYFQQLKIDGHSATPVYVFATADSKSSHRPWLTVKPTVKTLKLPDNHSIADADYAQVASQLTDGHYDHSTTLVCWHHGKIPDLMKTLGAKPKPLLGSKKWNPQVFGWLVELEYDHHGKLKNATVVNEHLMPDDTINPPKH